MFDKKNKNIKIKIWSGTGVHESYDTRLHRALARDLRLSGLDAEFRGQVSFEKLSENKSAVVKHPTSQAYKYVYTPSQTDAEQWLVAKAQGDVPEDLVMQITAHVHTTKGSLTTFKGFKILKCPAFTPFITYQKALTRLPFFISDIGAWLIIVDKNGRISCQRWLYRSFLAFESDGYKPVFGSEEEGYSYVNPDKKTVDEDSSLAAQLKKAERVIMVIADLHVGEKVSLAPAYFETEDGSVKRWDLTPANELVLKYWNHLVYMAKNVFKVTDVWVVGDCFAGTSVFEKNRDVHTTSLDEQLDAVLALFKMFK